MANTLASLVVTLEANIARFTADMGRAADITQGAMSGISKAADAAKTALAGVAAGLSAGALASMVQSSIAAAAALDDMAEKTGASVERLSAFSDVAKIGGHDINAVGDSIVKLAKSMVESGNSTSAQAKALATLGLSARDANGNLKNAGDFMVELARRLNDFSDGTGKTAIAIELLGKSGAQALPFLKDLAETGELNAKVTARQAAMAEEYEKNLKRLALANEDLVRSVGLAALPVLNDFVKALLDASTQAGGLRDTIRQLAAEGQLTEWAQNVAIGVATVIDTFRFMGAAAAAFGLSVGVVIEDLKLLATAYSVTLGNVGALSALPDMLKSRNTALAAANEAWSDLWNRNFRVMEDSLRKQFSLSKEAEKWNWSYTPAKPQIAISPQVADASEKAAKATKDFNAELDKLLNTLANRADSLSDDYYRKLGLLDYAYQQGKISMAEYTAAAKKLFDGTAMGQKILQDQAEATKRSTDQWKEQGEALKRAKTSYDEATRSADDIVKALEFEVDALTMTNSEREIAIQLRALEATGVGTLSDKYAEAAARIRELVETKEGLQAQIDLWQSIERAAEDAFVNILQSGKDAFDRLKDALKQGLMALLYQLTVKPFIVNIAAVVSGNPGIAGAVGGAGGGSFGNFTNLLSSASSLFGGAGAAAGSLASSFAMSGVGAGLGLSAEVGSIAGSLSLAVETAGAVGSSLTAAGAAFTAIASTVGTMVPVLGAALAIAYAAGVFDSEPSEVQGRFGIRSGSTGFEDNAFTGSQFGNIGFLDEGTQYFSGEAAQVFNQLIGDTLAALAERMSTAQIESLSTRLQGMDFGAFEGDYTTQDFLQQYGGEILGQVVAAAFDELEPALAALIRGFEGSADEVAALTNSLLAFYDVSRDLPETIRNQLIAALDDTAETIARITSLANAFATVQEAMNADPMEDALDAVRRATQGAFETFLDQTDALNEMIASFDGSTEAANDLAAATAAYYNSQVALLAQLHQLSQSVDETFGATARNIRFTTLDRDGQLDFLAKEMDSLLAQVMSSTDPEQIRRLLDQLNQDLSQSFGMLTPEEQQRRQQEYLDYIERANAAAQQHIQELQAEAQQRAADSETRLRNMLEEVIGKMGSSADKNALSSSTLLQAAREFPRTVTAVIQRSELTT